MEKLKVSKVKVSGANTDGKTLFLEIEIFDGEHTNKLRPTFPAGTTSETITAYIKGIIEDNPELLPEIVGLLGTTFYWDEKEESWYTLTESGERIREKGKDVSSHHPHHETKKEHDAAVKKEHESN